MSKEQRQGHPAHVKNDVYGFGAVLFEATTLHRLSELEKTIKSRSARHSFLAKMRHIPKEVGEGLITMIALCMHWDTTERPTFDQVR